MYSLTHATISQGDEKRNGLAVIQLDARLCQHYSLLCTIGLVESQPDKPLLPLVVHLSDKHRIIKKRNVMEQFMAHPTRMVDTQILLSELLRVTGDRETEMVLRIPPISNAGR